MLDVGFKQDFVFYLISNLLLLTSNLQQMGNLILESASRLDAFSAYPVQT